MATIAAVTAQHDRSVDLRLAHLVTALSDDVVQKITAARVLVVGAGGIGCELLKNLVMTGFIDIEDGTLKCFIDIEDGTLKAKNLPAIRQLSDDAEF